jgi:hypothetical protein
VAVSSGLPVGLASTLARFVSEPVRQRVALIASTSSIFETLGVAITSGRGFDDRDRAGSERVAILSQTLARQAFDRAEFAIGRQIRFLRTTWVGDARQEEITLTVVGVAADTDSGYTVGRRDTGTVYLPFAQQFEQRVTVIARTAGDPAPVVGVMRTLLGRIDANVPIVDSGTGVVMGGADNLSLRIVGGLAGLLGPSRFRSSWSDCTACYRTSCLPELARWGSGSPLGPSLFSSLGWWCEMDSSPWLSGSRQASSSVSCCAAD